MQDLEPLLAALRADRLLADLERFRAFGATDEGGVDRPALSPADVAARRALEVSMREAGLRVETDAVGNVWGRLGDARGPAVVAGSHLDSVPRGGRLDGPLGVFAALEVARAMRDAGVVPAVPYEVVSFTGEEGSRFARGTLGSWAASGVLSLDDALAVVDAEGVTLAEAMRAAGYPSDLSAPRAPEDRFRAFVELHVEQGGVLESKGVGLGVVRAIAGLTQLLVTVRGVANHAGTTPMDLRADALAGAAEMVLRIEARARAAGGQAVATVGRLEVVPNGLNVIPGAVHFGVDMRSAEPGVLQAVEHDVRRALSFVASVRKLTVEVALRQHVEPGVLDATLCARGVRACEAVGERCIEMDSGAIHDALKIAKAAPTAMLFVPSVGGKSHTPEEETTPADLERGLRALAAFVWDLCTPEEVSPPPASPALPTAPE